MRNIWILTFVVLLNWTPTFGQQDPEYSQYMFNTMAINPGYAGSNNIICATAVSRQQWIGFEGAPSTTIFHVNAAVQPFGISSGVGLALMNDQAGFDKNMGITGTYAYQKELGFGKLGIGLSFGMLNKSLDPNWVIPTSDFHTPASGDPLIPENKESVIMLDLGFGVFYKTEDFYLGLSSTHLNQPAARYSKGNPFVARHYYVMAGYNFQLPNPIFEILPSVLVNSDGKASQVTLNVNVLYNKKIWGGVSYRAGDAFIAIIGMELFNEVRVGYSYDFVTSDLRKNTGGTHELMIKYCFNVSLQHVAKRYKSVRFL